MRAALAASNSGSGSAGGEHWLLWLDSDVLVVDGAAALTNNFAADLVEAYSRPGADPRCRRPASNSGHAVDGVAAASAAAAADDADAAGVHFIVADQRDSLFGDVNAGVMLWKVSRWSLAFLEAWWDHPLALAGAYEQLVFNALWRANQLGVRTRAALAPTDALNSYPGAWWPAGGTGRRASPVLHLMQRSDTVRASVGQAASKRVCQRLPLAPPAGSALKHPQRPPTGAAAAAADATWAQAVDWVFVASRAALVDAAAALLASADDAVAGNQLVPPSEAGRVLFDLLLMAQSKEWRAAAANETVSDATASDASASDTAAANDATAAAAAATTAAAAGSVVAVSVGALAVPALPTAASTAAFAASPTAKSERCPASGPPVTAARARACLAGDGAAAWLAPRALKWLAAQRQLPGRSSGASGASGSSNSGNVNIGSSVVISGGSGNHRDRAVSTPEVSGSSVRDEAIFLELLAENPPGGLGSAESLWRRASSLREAHLPALHRPSDPPAAQSEFAASLGRLGQAVASSASSSSPGSAPSAAAAAARQAEAEDLLRKATRVRLAALGSHASGRHPDGARLQLDLAAVLEAQGGRSALEGGRLGEALALTRVAANDLEHALGPSHAWVAASVHRVASLLLQLVQKTRIKSLVDHSPPASPLLSPPYLPSPTRAALPMPKACTVARSPSAKASRRVAARATSGGRTADTTPPRAPLLTTAETAAAEAAARAGAQQRRQRRQRQQRQRRQRRQWRRLLVLHLRLVTARRWRRRSTPSQNCCGKSTRKLPAPTCKRCKRICKKRAP
jgi:hypothetical protein